MLYYDAILNDSFKIACFTVDNENLSGESFLGLPQVDYNKITDLYPPDEYDILIVLDGYKCMRNKEKLFICAKEKHYGLKNYISPKAEFSPDITMGENNIILSQTHIGPEGKMGNNNMIRQNTYLGHGFNVGNNNFIGAGCTIGGCCTIKNASYIGIGSTILSSLIIEEESLVGAGSVVIRNTEPYSRNVGNPSRIIGYHKEEGIMLSVNNV